MGAVTKLASWDEIPALSLKRVMITLANTADAGDTVDITLSDYGISATGLLAINGWAHTTDGSVVAVAANTSSVTTGVLTLTLVGGTTDDFRVIEIIGRADAGEFA
jgi:hypothetical protein